MVVIIAIVVSVALLSVNVLGRDSQLTEETQRLNQLIEAARQQAEMQGRDFGLSIYPEGYRFLRFDVRHGLWAAVPGDSLLRPRQFPAGIQPRLILEGRELVLKPLEEQDTARDEDKKAATETTQSLDDKEKEEAQRRKKAPPPPQIFILANGDLSPFELKLEREGTEHETLLTAKPDGTLEVRTADQPKTEPGK